MNVNINKTRTGQRSKKMIKMITQTKQQEETQNTHFLTYFKWYLVMLTARFKEVHLLKYCTFAVLVPQIHCTFK